MTPFQPAYAYYQITQLQTLITGGYRDINFESEVLNDFLTPNAGYNTFTFTQSGTYKIETTLWIVNTNSTLVRADGAIRLNNTIIATGQVMVQNSQADDLAGVTVHCFVVTPITINDSINIVAYVQANLPQGTTYIPTFDISLGEGSTKLFISKLR